MLRNCGPIGYPGMPEVGNMGLPPKLLRAGVRDMVRLSDARMSGTAYGTVVLHVCPEAAAGGPLGIVEEGDFVDLDVDNRRLHLDVTPQELEARRARLTVVTPNYAGYQHFFSENVLQADRGCDFGFLVGRRTAQIPREYL